VIALFPGLALTFDESIKPGGNVYSVLGAIEGLDVQHLLVVSHNPFLPNLLSVMADGTMESHRYLDNATLHCVSVDVIASGRGQIAYSLEP
jgi:phosphohistidine phosphatase SixA